MVKAGASGAAQAAATATAPTAAAAEATPTAADGHPRAPSAGAAVRNSRFFQGQQRRRSSRRMSVQRCLPVF